MIEASSFWGGPSFALPDPHRAEVSGQGTVLFAAGENVDFESHVDGDLNDYVGGTAETV